MTEHKYTHDGVTYIGLHSYSFGEMLLSWVTTSCSEFRVAKTPFSQPRYKGKLLTHMKIRAHSKQEVINHLEANIDIKEDEWLKVYNIAKIYISQRVVYDTLVDLCKPKKVRKRIVVL